MLLQIWASKLLTKLTLLLVTYIIEVFLLGKEIFQIHKIIALYFLLLDI